MGFQETPGRSNERDTCRQTAAQRVPGVPQDLRSKFISSPYKWLHSFQIGLLWIKALLPSRGGNLGELTVYSFDTRKKLLLLDAGDEGEEDEESAEEDRLWNEQGPSDDKPGFSPIPLMKS